MLEAYIIHEFREYLVTEYVKDTYFCKALRFLKYNKDKPLNFTSRLRVPFFIKDSLFFNIIVKERECLYILDLVLKNVFKEVYKKEYFGIIKTIYKLKGFCILWLIKRLKDFIKYCLSCLINLTLYI
jgi:hypothetical protein